MRLVNLTTLGASVRSSDIAISQTGSDNGDAKRNSDDRLAEKYE